MIDTANETTCKNPSCGKPVHQLPGHRRREYCNDTCKQTAYRLRKEQPHHGVTIVDDRQILDQANMAALQKKLIQAGQRIAKLERQVEIQRQRLGQSYKSTEAVPRIAELERELAAANTLIEQLLDKKQTRQPLKRSYQERLTRLGEKLDWPALNIHIRVQPGRKAWRVFMINESNDQLIRAIIAAERVEEKQP